jgi:Na+-translocating ferredoxin:NAD+ oxidoreductase RnfG subunit
MYKEMWANEVSAVNSISSNVTPGMGRKLADIVIEWEKICKAHDRSYVAL